VTYSVVVSKQVKVLLEDLYRDDRKRSRELALVLLRLEKDPRPEGSRRLVSAKSASSASEERVWDLAGFRIAYRVADDERLIEVGLVAEH
jgi:mRNA-degrading endonuclease RelE of RelBE toxin-antitoxin system